MTGSLFRPDIQDELLRLLFDKHRINLLKVPRQDLEPGQAFLVPSEAAGEAAPITFGPISLQNLVPGIMLPQPVRGAGLADVQVAYANSSESKAEAGIFAALLAKFLPGAVLPSLSAKVEATGAKNLLMRFSEATRDGIDFAALGKAVAAGTFDPSAIKDGASFRIFVVVDVYRCEKIEMAWTDGNGKVVDASLAVDELAKLGAGHKASKSSEGKVTVAGDAPLAFGIRLMELVERDDGPGLCVRLDHTKLDVLGEGRHDEDGHPLADDRDYAFLVDAWHGEVCIDVKPWMS